MDVQRTQTYKFYVKDIYVLAVTSMATVRKYELSMCQIWRSRNVC
jgi:hypothetical protein